MRLIQFLDGATRRVGALDDDDRVSVLAAEHTLGLIRSRLAGHAVAIPEPTLALADLTLLSPIDVPDNPWAMQLWGAGVTHKRSADAREQESAAATGTQASIYDRMYQAGVEGGRPAAPPGAKPEIFYKGNGFQLCMPGAPFERCDTARRLAPEPELVAWFVCHDGMPMLVGYSGGNDFSDQGWESENPLYLGHAKIQDSFTAVGPIFVHVEAIDVTEVEVRCVVHRHGEIAIDSGPLLTGEAHLAHSLENLFWHAFDHRAMRPDELRGLFLGTPAVFAEGVEPGDRIEITYGSGLGTLVNGVVQA